MLVYCALIWEGGKVSEESGDNLYYLGFIFTLEALMLAMAGTFINQESIELRLIVKAFGIALSTTVCGLIGRVLLISFVDERIGRDAHEVAHEDAMSALQELQMEVGSTVQTLSQWRTNAAEHWRDVREAEISGVRLAIEANQKLCVEQTSILKTTLADAYSDLEKCAEEAISQVKAVAEESTEQVKLVAQSGVAEMEGGFAKVGQASGELADSVAGAAQRRAGVRFDRVKQALDEAQKLIVEGFTELAEKAAGFGAQLQAAFPSEGEYRKAFDALNASLSETVQQNRAAMKQVQNAANETGAAFARVGEELKNAGSAMGIDQVSTSVQGLAHSMSQHRDSLAAVGEALAPLSGDLSRAARGVTFYAAEIEKVASELRSELKDIGELRRELSEVRQGLADDLMSSQQILRMVMNTLSEGVQQIRREIDSGGR
jgi:uncharacterized phage infection (PIP) family protein YhgE